MDRVFVRRLLEMTVIRFLVMRYARKVCGITSDLEVEADLRQRLEVI